MSKSILVIDTPNNCAGCHYCKEVGIGFECLVSDNDIEHSVSYGVRHPQCPLKDTTELLRIINKLENTIQSPFIMSDKSKQYYINKLYNALEGGIE